MLHWSEQKYVLFHYFLTQLCFLCASSPLYVIVAVLNEKDSLDRKFVLII